MEVAPLFALASFWELELRSYREAVGPVVVIPPGSSNIETLKFPSCVCHGPKMTNLVTACRKLKVFLHEHCTATWSLSANRERIYHLKPAFHVEDIVTALEAHHLSSLEHLAILHSGCGWADSPGRVCTLHHFQHLRSLLVSAWMLQAADKDVGCGSTGQTGKRQKVVVLRELQRAIIYTTR